MYGLSDSPVEDDSSLGSALMALSQGPDSQIVANLKAGRGPYDDAISPQSGGDAQSGFDIRPGMDTQPIDPVPQYGCQSAPEPYVPRKFPSMTILILGLLMVRRKRNWTL
jgi:hypothetical protein